LRFFPVQRSGTCIRRSDRVSASDSRNRSDREVRWCLAWTGARIRVYCALLYNDAAGVTAAFNLNMLTRLNRELDADFDLGTFRHWAHFQ
jgi:hypothetical protein